MLFYLSFENNAISSSSSLVVFVFDCSAFVLILLRDLRAASLLYFLEASCCPIVCFYSGVMYIKADGENQRTPPRQPAQSKLIPGHPFNKVGAHMYMALRCNIWQWCQ